MTLLFVSAFVLGLIFNAAPGAVFAETVRQGLRGGYRSALAVQLGSLVGDATWAALGLAGLGLLLEVAPLRVPIGIASVAYLLYFSVDAWRQAGREFRLDAKPAADSRRRALRSGMTLSLTNPQNLAYWAAIGSAMGALGVHTPQPVDYAVFFAGLMAASVLWCFVCAAGVAAVFRSVGRRWASATYRLCAAAFLVLALATLRELIQPSAANVMLPSPQPPAATGPR
jgi:chemosensory pili system protein ChpE